MKTVACYQDKPATSSSTTGQAVGVVPALPYMKDETGRVWALKEDGSKLRLIGWVLVDAA